jgi:hypothetical protein
MQKFTDVGLELSWWPFLPAVIQMSNMFTEICTWELQAAKQGLGVFPNHLFLYNYCYNYIIY